MVLTDLIELNRQIAHLLGEIGTPNTQTYKYTRDLIANIKSLINITDNAKKILSTLEEFTKLPYTSLEKAIKAIDMNLAEDESRIKVELGKLDNYVFEIHRIILQSKTFTYMAILRESTKQINELLVILEFLLSLGKKLDIEGFFPHLYGRTHLRSGGIKADFVFFIRNGESPLIIFKNKGLRLLIYELGYKNGYKQFHDLYEYISNWFFRSVIQFRNNQLYNLR